ncbi:MAG TPA: sigma-70 family RNA polymerase sigma factor [Gaiellaceae bacterium]|jgi:RNA polymerase primary sigma factor|nr:sigma-70 family RNA polymerase sigma factor [Gaiellaceae bacterium]
MSADLLDRLDEPAAATAALDDSSGPGSEDSLALYIRCVGRAPLLTLAEERALFRRKEAGDESATRRLIESNLRFVVWVARRYSRPGVPLLDLIQEGNLGLMRAVERFDYRVGCKLSTYAMWWIKEAVEQAAADYSQTLPMPIRVWRQVQHVRRARHDLFQRGNREPTLRELSAETGIDVTRVDLLLKCERFLVSLDAPMADGDSDLSDVVEDGNSPRPETAAVERMRREELGTVLSGLDDRLRLVLDLRFGLSDRTPRSLQEVGRRLGVTAERARQLEGRALRRLQEDAPELRAYLEAV